ncbi:MAG: hemerythrin domain-containing protein [Mycobacteriales bacterium]
MTVTTGGAVAAIRTHHRQLQAAIVQRVDDVLDAARTGRAHQDAVAALRDLLAGELLPHAAAEEDTLYAAATSSALRPLVTGMIFEHEALVSLAAELARAPTAVDAAAVARAIREIFSGHVRRENDVLLPNLDSDPEVDLAALLPVMESRFASYQARAYSDGRPRRTDT